MVKNILRKGICILLILTAVFLTLEFLQRSRRAYMTKNIDWLYYGFRTPKNFIPIEKAQAQFFREPFKILRKDEGKNLLFIGGSSTYGAYNDNLHTFPYLLQLKADNISCLNSGRSSLTSDGYLGILKRCYEEFFVPDMVIFYTGYNDMFIKSFNLKGSRFFNNRFVAKLERYSFLLVSIREKLMIYEQIKRRKDPLYRARFIREFEKNIEECIEFAKNKGIDVVLIPEVLAAERFSSSITNDYRWYKDLYLEIPEVLKNLSRKYDCYFLDAKEALYKDWEGNFMDPVHLTDKGNEVMSEFLLDNLPLETR